MSLWWRLVKFGFRLLYNEFAFTYDVVSWLVSFGEWRSWQRAALKHLDAKPGDSILEVAHGTGNLQLDLQAAGLSSVACDLSAYMGGIARRKLTGKGIGARLLQAKAQQLPFQDAAFTAVVSTFPTNFIIDPATIGEVYRVLKHGGRLVFVPNGALTGGGMARHGLEAAYRATGQRGGWPDDIQARFSAAGFVLNEYVEPCRISIAYVVVAEKQLPPPSEGVAG